MSNYKFIMDIQIDNLTNSLFFKNIKIYGFINFNYDSDILKVSTNTHCSRFWVDKASVYSNSSSKYKINVYYKPLLSDDNTEDKNINACWKISFESYDEMSSFYIRLLNEVHKLFQKLGQSNSNRYIIQPGTVVHVKSNLLADWNERIFLCKYLNNYYCLTDGLAENPNSKRAIGWKYCLEDPGSDDYEYYIDSDGQSPCTVTYTWKTKGESNTETDE